MKLVDEYIPYSPAELRILNSPLSENAVFQFIFSKPECLQILLQACPPIGPIRLIAVHHDRKLTPNVGQHEYILDVVGEGEYVDTGTRVIIDLEMQNRRDGSEQVRGETYAAAVRCTVTERGEGWKDMPEVISIFFVNEIPDHPELYYRVSSFHSYGYSGSGKEFEDDESKTMLIYVRLGLDKQTELLEQHPELRLLADIVHDLPERTGRCMLVDVIAEAMLDLKENRQMLFKCSQETYDWGMRLQEEAYAKAYAEASAEIGAMAEVKAAAERKKVILRMFGMGTAISTIAEAFSISEAEVKAIIDGYDPEK